MNTSKIKVSVIILTYNHGKYVRQAIESVLDQKVSFPMEIIVADDKSTDQTRDIIGKFHEKFPDLVKPIFRDENVGTTRNICDAFLRSRGEYLIAFGGDDYWIDSKKLQIQVDWLDKHPDYIGVSHVLESRNNEGTVLRRYPSARLIGKTVSSELFLKGFYFPTPTTLFRNIFQGENAESFIHLITTSRLVEDVSLAMILLDTGKVHVLDRCMSVYRVNAGASDTNYNSMRDHIQTFQDHIEIYEANEKFFMKKYDFSRLYAEKAIKAFLNGLMNHKIGLFYSNFMKISPKARLVSIAYFPVYTSKILWRKVLALRILR